MGVQQKKVCLIVLGEEYTGKSSTGNMILGYEAFPVDGTPEPLLIKSQVVEGKNVTVVNAIGWEPRCHPNIPLQNLERAYNYASFNTASGPLALLLTVPISNNKMWNQSVAQRLQNLFNENVWRHTILLFTRAETLRGASVELFLKHNGQPFQSLLQKCGQRYHALDTLNVENRQQVRELLDKVDLMVVENGGKCFHSKTKSFWDEDWMESCESTVPGQMMWEKCANMNDLRYEVERIWTKLFSEFLAEKMRRVQLPQENIQDIDLGSVTVKIKAPPFTYEDPHTTTHHMYSEPSLDERGPQNLNTAEHINYLNFDEEPWDSCGTNTLKEVWDDLGDEILEEQQNEGDTRTENYLCRDPGTILPKSSKNNEDKVKFPKYEECNSDAEKSSSVRTVCESLDRQQEQADVDTHLQNENGMRDERRNEMFMQLPRMKDTDIVCSGATETIPQRSGPEKPQKQEVKQEAVESSRGRSRFRHVLGEKRDVERSVGVECKRTGIRRSQSMDPIANLSSDAAADLHNADMSKMKIMRSKSLERFLVFGCDAGYQCKSRTSEDTAVVLMSKVPSPSYNSPGAAGRRATVPPAAPRNHRP